MARPIVMPLLSSITHLEGTDLKALAPFTPAILDSVEGHLDDLKLAETALCIVAHSTTLVLKDDHPDPALASLVSLPRIIQFFLSVVRLPTSTSPSFNHLLEFCAQTAEYHPMVFRSIPDSVDFLIACTRANDLCARNAALRSLDPHSVVYSSQSTRMAGCIPVDHGTAGAGAPGSDSIWSSQDQ
ncbi:hypothetical protein C8R43DRAFT_1137361 [Mycena crocata]|nr:hypothetical protein C8R43DRAFT_1137361 [Mycena crocata]